MSETKQRADIEIEALNRQIDDEFGESPTYWYCLLSIGMPNQPFAETIIRRIQEHARRSA